MPPVLSASGSYLRRSMLRKAAILVTLRLFGFDAASVGGVRSLRIFASAMPGSYSRSGQPYQVPWWGWRPRPRSAPGCSSYHLWLHWVVTCNELKRLLASQGCIFSEGRRPTFVRLGTRTTLLPHHGKSEIKTGTLRSVLNALGLTLDKLQRER